MKKFSVVAILIAILTLGIVAFAAAEDTETESVSFYEANGREICIYLNMADKKSACENGVKTVYLTKVIRKNTLKGKERYKGAPYAVSFSYPLTTRTAKILYRNPDTMLDNLKNGLELVRRGLDSNGKRVSLEEASFIFQAKLDKEGRKQDFVDIVFTIDGVTQSITHIEVNETVRNYYLVDGDARKPEPKKPTTTTSSTTPTPAPDTTQPTSEPDPDEDPVETVPPQSTTTPPQSTTPNPQEDPVETVPPQSTTTPPPSTNTPPSTTTPPQSTTTPPPSNTPNPQEDEVILVPPQGDWGN